MKESRNDLFASHTNISRTCKVGHAFEAVLVSHLNAAVLVLKNGLKAVTLKQLMEETANAQQAPPEPQQES